MKHVKLNAKEKQIRALQQEVNQMYGTQKNQNSMNNQISTLVTVGSNGQVQTDSLTVAQIFGKRHDHVTRDIEEMACSYEFNAANFGEIKYTDSRGREQRAYQMTKDGFVFLVMGYRGRKASEFKEKYIRAFNQMEQALKQAPQIESQRITQLENQVNILLTQSLDQAPQIHELTHYSVVGYAKKHGIKGVYNGRAMSIGKKCSALCKAQGLEVQKVNHASYGTIGAYPVAVLKQVFEWHLNTPIM